MIVLGHDRSGREQGVGVMVVVVVEDESVGGMDMR